MFFAYNSGRTLEFQKSTLEHLNALTLSQSATLKYTIFFLSNANALESKSKH